MGQMQRRSAATLLATNERRQAGINCDQTLSWDTREEYCNQVRFSKKHCVNNNCWLLRDKMRRVLWNWACNPSGMWWPLVHTQTSNKWTTVEPLLAKHKLKLKINNDRIMINHSWNRAGNVPHLRKQISRFYKYPPENLSHFLTLNWAR